MFSRSSRRCFVFMYVVQPSSFNECTYRLGTHTHTHHIARSQLCGYILRDTFTGVEPRDKDRALATHAMRTLNVTRGGCNENTKCYTPGSGVRDAWRAINHTAAVAAAVEISFPTDEQTGTHVQQGIYLQPERKAKHTPLSLHSQRRASISQFIEQQVCSS